MTRRLALALSTLAAGAGLLTAATLGTAAAAAPTSGIFKVGDTGNLDSVDPAIAYGTTSWLFQYAAGAFLYSYPDSGAQTLVPEVAKRFTVSKDGRMYHFYLHGGYRFSDGAPVTARNFQYAIQRALNRDLGSPAAGFIRSKTVYVKSVSAHGHVLTVRLARPAPQLIQTLALPFFQAPR
jgi:peptide/nickel transport system substrate-binding protein